MATLLQHEEEDMYSAYPAPLTRRGNSGGQQLGRKPVHGFGPKRAWDGVAVLARTADPPFGTGDEARQGNHSQSGHQLLGAFSQRADLLLQDRKKTRLAGHGRIALTAATE